MSTSTPLLSEQFADHALTTRYEDLTPDAISQAKVFILDTIGVGISGSSAYGASHIISTASSWGTSPQSTLWGRRAKLPAPQAALANAFQIHCQEYDCVHEAAVLHPMATLLPALLAHTDRTDTKIDGKELIVACAVGVTVSAGLGMASRSAMSHFRPATCGGFGAVAGLGRLMGLSKEQLVQAFGLMYTQTSGNLQPHAEGTAALPLQVGWNSRGAVQACDLAAAGMQGTRDVFEGKYGYMKLFEGPEDYDLAETKRAMRGERWLIAEMSHKPFPAGRVTHGGVEGLMRMMEGGGGPRTIADGEASGEKYEVIKAEDVESVVITGTPVSARLCSRPDVPDPSPNYARLCMSYIAAKVLLNGEIDLAHYRGKELTDAKTHELAKKVKMVSDGSSNPNALLPITVEVTTKKGKQTWRCEQMLASPTRRLTREQHLKKFKRCWEFSAEKMPNSQRDELIKVVDELESLSDVRYITALVTPSGPVLRSQL